MKMLRGFLVALFIGSATQAAALYDVSAIAVPGEVITGSKVSINDSDQIVGNILPAFAAMSSDYEPFAAASSGGNIISLAANQYATFSQINNAGIAVGFVFDNNLEFHGLIYQNGLAQTVDLSGMADVRLDAINDSGQIVGTSDAGGFLLSGGVATPLAGPVSSLNAINDRGDIVGWGFYDDTPSLFLLTPIPEPAVISFFAGFAFVVLRSRHRPIKINRFLELCR